MFNLRMFQSSLQESWQASVIQIQNMNKQECKKTEEHMNKLNALKVNIAFQKKF